MLALLQTVSSQSMITPDVVQVVLACHMGLSTSLSSAILKKTFSPKVNSDPHDRRILGAMCSLL